MYPINQLLIIIVILFSLIMISYWLNPDKALEFNQPRMDSKKKCQAHGQCNAHTCGKNGIDPVSDPAYNMKQIIKQSILLEEHLSEANKRCRDCIVKHFLHIQGLHEEALWLANERCGDYPMLIETTSFYSEQFDEWINAYDDNKTLLQIAGKLRDVRKKLVSLYYFNDEENTEDTVLVKKEKNIETKDYREVLNDVRIPENLNNQDQTPQSLSINSYDRIY